MPTPRSVNLSLFHQIPALYPDTDRGTVIFGSGGVPPKEPKIINVENAMPTEYGFKSLSKIVLSSKSLPATPTFQYTQLLLVEDANGIEGLYYCAGSPSVGHYVYKPDSDTWATVSTASDTETAQYPTVAILNGEFYAHKKNFGVFTFTSGFASINVETVQGITATSMYGICSALDYMIAWDLDTIYWSAPEVPLDFRPTVSSVSTGAGSMKLQALRGTITRCVPIAGGFIVYGTRNAISMKYSGNSLNPWIAEEIEASGGLPLVNELVGRGMAVGSHFVYSDKGLQEVNTDRASPVFPSVSSFLAQGKFSSSNHDGTFTVVTNAFMQPRIMLVSDRYVCISIKTSSSTYYSAILVYDRLYQSWGQVTVDHYDLWDFAGIDTVTPLTILLATPGAIGVWKTNGNLEIIYLDFPDRSALATMVPITGEIIWSDFTLTNSSIGTVTDVKFGINGDDGISFDLYDLPYYQNIQYSAEIAFTESPANSGQYQQYVTADSHRLRIRGNFEISNAVVTIVQRGSR